MPKTSAQIQVGKTLISILKVHNMPKTSAQPQVGKTSKLCKKTYLEGT
jgi:hypothetical protein